MKNGDIVKFKYLSVKKRKNLQIKLGSEKKMKNIAH